MSTATQDAEQKINGKHKDTPLQLVQEHSMATTRQDEKFDELLKAIEGLTLSRERQDDKVALERQHEREIFERIANSLDHKSGTNAKNVIAAVVGIVGVVLLVAAYIA